MLIDIEGHSGKVLDGMRNSFLIEELQEKRPLLQWGKKNWLNRVLCFVEQRIYKP